MRWEYRVLHDLQAPELAELGEEGWEIIAAEFDDDGEIWSALAKRPKHGGGGEGGQGGGGGGGGGRRRRRRGPGGGQGGGNRIGQMTGPGGQGDGY